MGYQGGGRGGVDWSFFGGLSWRIMVAATRARDESGGGGRSTGRGQSGDGPVAWSCSRTRQHPTSPRVPPGTSPCCPPLTQPPNPQKERGAHLAEDKGQREHCRREGREPGHHVDVPDQEVEGHKHEVDGAGEEGLQGGDDGVGVAQGGCHVWGGGGFGLGWGGFGGVWFSGMGWGLGGDGFWGGVWFGGYGFSGGWGWCWRLGVEWEMASGGRTGFG